VTRNTQALLSLGVSNVGFRQRRANDSTELYIALWKSAPRQFVRRCYSLLWHVRLLVDTARVFIYASKITLNSYIIKKAESCISEIRIQKRNEQHTRIRRSAILRCPVQQLCEGSGPAVWNTRKYPKVSGLAAWSENCKWYSSLPLGAVVPLLCESV
jgi:hypothetical protein